eukprot:1179668-Prorocentrum_minimum.AAC.4
MLQTCGVLSLPFLPHPLPSTTWAPRGWHPRFAYGGTDVNSSHHTAARQSRPLRSVAREMTAHQGSVNPFAAPADHYYRCTASCYFVCTWSKDGRERVNELNPRQDNYRYHATGVSF